MVELDNARTDFNKWETNFRQKCFLQLNNFFFFVFLSFFVSPGYEVSTLAKAVMNIWFTYMKRPSGCSEVGTLLHKFYFSESVSDFKFNLLMFSFPRFSFLYPMSSHNFCLEKKIF